MLKIDQETKKIMLTRGNKAIFTIKIKNKDGSFYQFQVGDKITLGIYENKNYQSLKLKKEVVVAEAGDSIDLILTKEDTKLDDPINKPKDYWYEVELNGEETIIGYDDMGAKIFTLYPEGE